MPDWYRDHSLSPECYPESEYLDWAQDKGLHVDAAGNVGYGPPEPHERDDTPFVLDDEDVTFAGPDSGSGLDDWEF